MNGSSSHYIVITTADKKRSGQLQFLSAQEVLAGAKGKDDLKMFIHKATALLIRQEDYHLKRPVHMVLQPTWTEKERKRPAGFTYVEVCPWRLLGCQSQKDKCIFTLTRRSVLNDENHADREQNGS